MTFDDEVFANCDFDSFRRRAEWFPEQALASSVLPLFLLEDPTRVHYVRELRVKCYRRALMMRGQVQEGPFYTGWSGGGQGQPAKRTRYGDLIEIASPACIKDGTVVWISDLGKRSPPTTLLEPLPHENDIAGTCVLRTQEHSTDVYLDLQGKGYARHET